MKTLMNIVESER